MSTSNNLSISVDRVRFAVSPTTGKVVVTNPEAIYGLEPDSNGKVVEKVTLEEAKAKVIIQLHEVGVRFCLNSDADGVAAFRRFCHRVGFDVVEMD